jgi:hypothetical protein
MYDQEEKSQTENYLEERKALLKKEENQTILTPEENKKQWEENYREMPENY